MSGEEEEGAGRGPPGSPPSGDESSQGTASTPLHYRQLIQPGGSQDPRFTNTGSLAPSLSLTGASTPPSGGSGGSSAVYSGSYQATPDRGGLAHAASRAPWSPEAAAAGRAAGRRIEAAGSGARVGRGEGARWQQALALAGGEAPLLAAAPAAPAVNEVEVARYLEASQQFLPAERAGGAAAAAAAAALAPLPEDLLDRIWLGGESFRNRLIGIPHWSDSATAQLLAAGPAAVNAATVAALPAVPAAAAPAGGGAAAAAAAAGGAPPRLNGFQILRVGPAHPLYWDVLSTLIIFFLVDGYAHDQIYVDGGDRLEINQLAKAVLVNYPTMPPKYIQKIRDTLSKRLGSDAAGKACLEALYQELMLKLGFDTGGPGVQYIPYAEVGRAAATLKRWTADKGLAITVDSVSGEWRPFLDACKGQYRGGADMAYTSSALEDGDPATKKGFNSFGPIDHSPITHAGDGIDLVRSDAPFTFAGPAGATVAAAAVPVAPSTPLPGVLGMVSVKGCTFARLVPGGDPSQLRATLTLDFVGAPNVQLQVDYDYVTVSIASMRSLEQSLRRAGAVRTFPHEHEGHTMTITILNSPGFTFATISGDRENRMRFYVAVRGLKTNGDLKVVTVGGKLYNIEYTRYINQGRPQTLTIAAQPPTPAKGASRTVNSSSLAFLQFTFDKIARQLNDMMAASLSAQFHAEGLTLRQGLALVNAPLTPDSVSELLTNYTARLAECGVRGDTETLFTQGMRVRVRGDSLTLLEQLRARIAQRLDGFREVVRGDRAVYGARDLDEFMGQMERHSPDIATALIRLGFAGQPIGNQIRILVGLLMELDREIGASPVAAAAAAAVAAPAAATAQAVEVQLDESRLSRFGSAVRAAALGRVDGVLSGYFPPPGAGGSVTQAILTQVLRGYHRYVAENTVEASLRSDQFARPFDILTAQNYNGLAKLFESQEAFLDALVSLDTGKLSSDSSRLAKLLGELGAGVPNNLGQPAQREIAFRAIRKFFYDLGFREVPASNAAMYTLVALLFSSNARIRTALRVLQPAEAADIAEPDRDAPDFTTATELARLASELFTDNGSSKEASANKCLELVQAYLEDNTDLSLRGSEVATVGVRPRPVDVAGGGEADDEHYSSGDAVAELLLASGALSLPDPEDAPPSIRGGGSSFPPRDRVGGAGSAAAASGAGGGFGWDARLAARPAAAALGASGGGSGPFYKGPPVLAPVDGVLRLANGSAIDYRRAPRELSFVRGKNRDLREAAFRGPFEARQRNRFEFLQNNPGATILVADADGDCLYTAAGLSQDPIQNAQVVRDNLVRAVTEGRVLAISAAGQQDQAETNIRTQWGGDLGLAAIQAVYGLGRVNVTDAGVRLPAVLYHGEGERGSHFDLVVPAAGRGNNDHSRLIEAALAAVESAKAANAAATAALRGTDGASGTLPAISALANRSTLKGTSRAGGQTLLFGDAPKDAGGAAALARAPSPGMEGLEEGEGGEGAWAVPYDRNRAPAGWGGPPPGLRAASAASAASAKTTGGVGFRSGRLSTVLEGNGTPTPSPTLFGGPASRAGSRRSGRGTPAPGSRVPSIVGNSVAGHKSRNRTRGEENTTPAGAVGGELKRGRTLNVNEIEEVNLVGPVLKNSSGNEYQQIYGTADYLKIAGANAGSGEKFTLMHTNEKGVSWFAEGGARKRKTHRKQSKKSKRSNKNRRRTQRNKK